MINFKRDLLIFIRRRTLFILLTLLIIVLQYFILKPHLRYGFADVDWMFLLDFKQLSIDHHNPIAHLINAWEKWGVYTYQVYYIGLIDHFFGLNYRNFQIVTHIFKVIAILSIYPMIYVVTRSKLAAFLTTLIYAVSYPSVGVMYTVVTSGLFVAIPVMSLFFIWYWYLINRGKNKLWEIILWITLFFSTLLLATERMYPLLIVIVLIEFFWWFKNGYSKAVLFQILKRLSIFFILFLTIFIYKPSIITPVSGNAAVTYKKLIEGNWHVVLSPFISLGGLFIPKDYWKIFGVVNIDNSPSYLGFILSGPLIIFSFISLILAFFVSHKPLRFLKNIAIFSFILIILVYILSTHRFAIAESLRMNFDSFNVTPALIGSYVLSFVLSLFIEWFNGGKKDKLLISIVGGIVISFIFITMTWIAADWILIFTGVHRYLTLPAIGSSLMIAGLITLVFNKLKSNQSTKILAFTTLLLLIPITLFNTKVITDYFNYELNYAGTEASGHIRMKTKLWSYLNNFSNTEPSLFYLDESQDHDNGYFDETTVMAGFNYWMRFRGDDIVDMNLTPALLRSNLICSEVKGMCLSKVKSFVAIKDGEKGILYGGVFYKKENFYAFRFVNRDIVDIKQEVGKIIGLE